MIAHENQRNMLVIVVAVLLASNLYLAVSLARTEKTIVMIPTIDKEMSVGTHTVSEDYLLYRAEQIMQLLFNIRHENYAYNANQILAQVSSSNKPEFTKQLEEFTEDVKSKKYFYVFNKDSYSIDNKRLNIIFSGYLETYVNDKKIDTNHKKYKLTFTNNSGLVKLTSFEEIKDAKT